MSEAIQITLIVCGTIIFCNLIVLFTFKNIWNKEKKPPKSFGYTVGNVGTNDTSRLDEIFDKHGHYKGKIGHNPSPIGEKPGFPGRNGYQPKLRYHDNSELEKMRKPPSTGSGIK